MGFTDKPFNAVSYIKIMGLKKEEKQHYFEVDKEKVDMSTFQGRLIKIEHSTYEYEGLLRDTIKALFIDDTHKYYQLDVSFNMLSRGLINTLLGYVDSQKKLSNNNGIIDLELSLYLNKEGFKQMGIKVNGSRSNWRFSLDDQKKMIETIVKKNGTKENDYFEYDKKLIESISEIQNFITITNFIEEKQQDDGITLEDVDKVFE